MSENTTSRETQRSAWLAAAVIVFGIALRFADLGSQSLMIDESTYTLPVIRMPVQQMLATLLEIGTNPPLYYLIQKAVLPLAGYDEAGLRLLSAVADSISLLLAALLGYRLAGWAGRFAAAAFWAFNPLALWTAQVGRPYALSTTLALLLLLLFLHLREHPSGLRGYAAAFLLVSIGLLTHYFFFMVVAGTLSVATLGLRQHRRLFRGWTIACLLGGLGLALWLRAYFALPNPVLGIGWIRRPGVGDYFLTLWNLASGYGGRFDPATAMYGLAVAACLAAAFIGRSRRQFALRLLLGGVLAPVAGVWIVSQYRPMFIDRYLGPLLPFYAALAALGAQRLHRSMSADRVSVAVRAAVVLALGAWTGWTYHTDLKYELEDWRGLAGQMEDVAGAEQEIWATEVEFQPAFDFYYAGEISVLAGSAPPVCSSCWYVLRQPYTMLHAYTPALTDPARPWYPDLPLGCSVLSQWEGVGLALWQVGCLFDS